MNSPGFDITPAPAPGFDISVPATAQIKLTKDTSGVQNQPKRNTKGKIPVERLVDRSKERDSDNFISRLSYEYGTNFDNFKGDIKDVKATIAKNPDGSYQFEVMKFPDDYADGATKPNKPHLKVKIKWEVVKEEASIVMDDHYFDTGVEVPDNLDDPKVLLEIQQYAALRTKAYIQLMKAPLSPQHAEFSKASQLIRYVVDGKIEFTIPVKQSMSKYGVTHLAIRHGSGRLEFAYDHTTMAKSLSVDASGRPIVMSRREKIENKAKLSTITDGGKRINQSLVDIQKAYQDTRSNPSTIIDYCQTNGISLAGFADGLKLMIDHDKQKYARLLEFFKTGGMEETPGFMKRILDKLLSSLGRKPNFEKLVNVYNQLIQQNKTLKTQSEDLKKQIEELDKQIATIVGEDSAAKTQRQPLIDKKNNLQETFTSLTTSRQKLEHYINQFEDNLVQLKAVQSSWNTFGTQLRTIENHIALQLANEVLAKEFSAATSVTKQKLEAVIGKLTRKEELTKKDQIFLFHKILYPRSFSIAANPSPLGDMSHAEAYQTMIKVRDLRIFLITGSSADKQETVTKVQKIFDTINADWERISPLVSTKIIRGDEEIEISAV